MIADTLYACSCCVTVYKCGNYRATVNGDKVTVFFFFFNASRATKKNRYKCKLGRCKTWRCYDYSWRASSRIETFIARIFKRGVPEQIVNGTLNGVCAVRTNRIGRSRNNKRDIRPLSKLSNRKPWGFGAQCRLIVVVYGNNLCRPGQLFEGHVRNSVVCAHPV